MCGITGILLPDEAWVPAGQIEAMTATLVHRGPDSEGYYRNRGVALGHRRLQVIDLLGGAQPMSNEDGSIWVTFNGEIYDFVELRRRLTSLGHVFRSRSDSEVLVHAYEQWGDDLLEKISGMFAFAIWDGRRRRALLARDRMGQKPLFYKHTRDGGLIFGSEAKALVAHPEVVAEVDPQALATYLSCEYLPGELCMFKGLRKLRASHILTWEAGRIAQRSYWDLPFHQQTFASTAEAEEAFMEAFDRSVRQRLVADVPLGIFLSGGVDSSAVAAMAVRHRPASSIKTFAIGFDDSSFDESWAARLVAKHLGTDHHQQIFSTNSLLDTLPQVVDKLDEPFGDASLLPTTLLSAFTRQSVTVALSGDGGDELLLGYPTFKAELFANCYCRLPRWTRRFIERQAASIPIDTRNFSLDFMLKSFLKGASRPTALRHPIWLGSFVPQSADDPLEPALRRLHPLEQTLSPFTRAWHEAPQGIDDLQRLSYQYARTYLAEDILVKLDRASMSVSLEARSPFLDHRLVELITSLPSSMKLRWNLLSKYILKRAFLRDLPPEVLLRKKKGFGIPLAKWLKGPLREMMLDLLANDRLARAGFLKPAVVQRLVEEHLRGRRDNRKLLWTLLCFELWRDRHGVQVNAFPT